MHFNASHSLTQPLLDCMLYLTQYLYDPGTLPTSANQCILGNVYLRSNLSREQWPCTIAGNVLASITGCETHGDMLSTGWRNLSGCRLMPINLAQCTAQTIGQVNQRIVIYFVGPQQPFVQLIIDQPVDIMQQEIILQCGTALPCAFYGHSVCYKDWLVGTRAQKRQPTSS